MVNPSDTVGLLEVFPIPGGSSLVIPLENITYDCDTEALNVVSRAYGSQTIVPDIMELSNIAFSLSLTLTDVQTLTVTFSGEWSIGKVNINVQVQYTRSTGEFDITATPSGASFDFLDLAKDFTGLTLPDPFAGGISFDSFVLSGIIASDDSVSLIISQTLHATQIYLIFEKPSGENAQKAIAAEFSEFHLSSLISQVTSLDISGVPYFGSITVPAIGLTISSADINGLPTGTFDASTLLSSNRNTVESGVTAYLKFSFSDQPIKMKFDKKVTFSLSAGSVSVNDLLSLIPDVDLTSIPLPFDINIISSVDIVSFSLSSDAEKALSIEVTTPNLSFFDGLIVISDDDISLYLSRKPTKVKVEVSGNMKVGQSSFTASLSLDGSDNYVLQAAADTLPITSAISQFQAEVLPSDLNSLLKDIPFLSFSIDKPSLTYPFSSEPKQIQFGGTPVIEGYDTVHMDAILIRQASKSLLVLGFDIGAVNLADILHTISGFSFNSIAILNQDLDAALLISPVTLPSIHLDGKKLKDISITKGVSVQAQMAFPSDCTSDLFCAVAQSLLGADAKLMLQGTFESTSSFSIIAGVSDIKVGSGITISNAGLEIQVGTETSVGITGSIVLSDPAITLTSKIFLSTSGVVLKMTQTGCWNHAFGADWLAICNILGSIGMVPGVTVTSLEVGGEIHLGDAKCSTPITAIGYLGIDTVTPTNNYYYVQFTESTTVSSLISAFCFNINLPRPLGESGFPNGFLSSFSLLGTEVPNAGISILQGYRLNGTLDILGLEGSADVTINLPTGIKFNVALPPISIGNGLLQMSVSSSDKTRGPFLKADVILRPSPKVDIAASGYVKVL